MTSLFLALLMPRELPLLGTVRPRPAREIRASIWSVGAETLDRDFGDYDAYKTYLGDLGAKAVRLQAGWAKCERVKGKYEWAWLDHVVDDCRKRGLKPWLQASYGNPIYPGGGGAGLGGVLPKGDEALAAWDRWVEALTRRYRGRVDEWEIWNEPDLHATDRPDDASEYAALFVRTARIVRREAPKAKVLGLACCWNLKYAASFFDLLARAGNLGLIDVATFHAYFADPDDLSFARDFEAVVRRHSHRIEVRQGENGCPSTNASFGALSGLPWTERSQAKWVARRIIVHAARELPFNLFTISDLHYPDRVNTKGLLKTNSDKSIAYAKPAYRAAQTLFALFDGRLRPTTPVRMEPGIRCDLFRTGSGAFLAALWRPEGAPKDGETLTPARVTFPGVRFKRPVLVDPISGEVRSLSLQDAYTLPLSDAPILVAERSIVPIVSPARR